MALDENQERPGFSELLAELTDSDVVVELAAKAGARTPDAERARAVANAIEASYQALAGGVPVQLATVALVEEVARHSRSLWLRVEVKGNGALAESSDASLLKFLARGTLAIVAWMEGSATLQLADLQQAIRVLAWGTSITTAAHPVLPSSASLVKAVVEWQKAKQALDGGESVRIVTNNGSAPIDPTKRIADPRSLLLARKLTTHSAEMIFVVEMPDYAGTGEWQLKHGEHRTTAIAEPGTMLDKFYQRELDIRPGDALRCRADLETSYGPDHEVLAERYRIVEIIEVLPAANHQPQPPSGAAEPGADHEVVGEFEEAVS